VGGKDPLALDCVSLHDEWCESEQLTPGSQTAGAIMQVRCITLNLEGLKHDWFGKRFKIVSRGLEQYRPDVVCLQETTIRYAGDIYNQAQDVAQAAGFHSVAFAPYSNPTEIMSPDHESGSRSTTKRRNGLPMPKGSALG
jgi:class 3 adenylate cyclase